jgi:hypothetical protein
MLEWSVSTQCYKLLASNYGGIIAYFLMPAIATGKEKIGFTVCVIRNYILFD